MPSVLLAQVHHHEATFDSPPELTLSKSSKSSGSFRSSCLSDAVSLENLSHFEEISLDDIGIIQSGEPDSLGLKRATTLPPPRPVYHVKPKAKRSSHTVDSMHSVHVARTQDGFLPILPGTPLTVNTTSRPTSRPTSRSSQLASTARSQSRQTRSNSPRKSVASSAGGDSPRSLGSFSFLDPKLPFGRRGSWQPGRKTVKELEAEFHNSDEEIPEDAVMHNVPVSPLVLSAHHSRAGSIDPGSTPRRPSAQSFKTSPSGTPSPNSPTHPGLPRSATIDGFPSQPGMPTTLVERTKSWANCLSADARHLSDALDAHAQSQDGPERSQSTSTLTQSPSRSSTPKLQYPPLQRNNIMIDPLPISKEKEAVLARTRPSWLPPKCKKEEKRHLRQWEKMMVQSEESERIRQDKAIKKHEQVLREKAVVNRAWIEHIVPDWEEAMQESTTRELWWRGVPTDSRGVVWSRAIGNDLELTIGTYTAALSRATNLEKDLAGSPGAESQGKEASWFGAIERDSRNAFPETGFFTSGSEHNQTLQMVLKAYTMYRSDVGYVHGLHNIAALLVLNTCAASDAFIMLANVLNESLPLAYLIQDTSIIERWQTLVLKTLQYKLPHLHRHLLSAKTGFSSPQEWLEPLLSTLLTHNLRADSAARIWDVYVFEGDKFMVRAVAGIMSKLGGDLFGSREEILSLLGWDASAAVLQSKLGGDEEQIMQTIRDAGKMDKENQ